MRGLVIVSVATVVLWGCKDGSAPQAHDEPGGGDDRPTTWVTAHYAGGCQCDDCGTAVGLDGVEPVKKKETKPEEVLEALADGGVEVLDREIEDLPVPTACGYPSWSRNLWVKVYEEDLGKAAALGLEESARPGH